MSYSVKKALICKACDINAELFVFISSLFSFFCDVFSPSAFFFFYCSLSPLVAFPIPHPPCSYWPCADPSVIRWVRSEGRQMNEEVHGFDLGLSFQVPCRLCPGSTSLCWSSGVSVTLLSLWRQRANDTPFYPCLASSLPQLGGGSGQQKGPVRMWASPGPAMAPPRPWASFLWRWHTGGSFFLL